MKFYAPPQYIDMGDDRRNLIVLWLTPTVILQCFGYPWGWALTVFVWWAYFDINEVHEAMNEKATERNGLLKLGLTYTFGTIALLGLLAGVMHLPINAQSWIELYGYKDLKFWASIAYGFTLAVIALGAASVLASLIAYCAIIASGTPLRWLLKPINNLFKEDGRHPGFSSAPAAVAFSPDTPSSETQKPRGADWFPESPEPVTQSRRLELPEGVFTDDGGLTFRKGDGSFIARVANGKLYAGDGRYCGEIDSQGKLRFW